MMASNLVALISRGAVRALNIGGGSRTCPDPLVLQLLSHRRFVTGGPTGYQLILSDGEQVLPMAGLGLGLNHMVEKNQLPDGAVIRVMKHVIKPKTSDCQPIFVVMELEVLGVCAPISSTVKPAPRLPQRLPHRRVSLDDAFADVDAAAPAADDRLDALDTEQLRPIAALNPYQSVWTVTGRVTQKSQLRHWANRRGEGQLFSFVLSDKSDCLRVTAFQAVAEKCFRQVEVGRLLCVTGGQVRAADKRFSGGACGDYELVLNSQSQLLACKDSAAAAVPEMKFSLVPINQLTSVEPDALVDLCAVVHETGDCQTIRGRSDGRQIPKRDLLLVDSSAWSVRCTLWGAEAASFNGAAHPVVVIRGARVTGFAGRSLSVTAGSCLLVEPACPAEVARQRAWYHAGGGARAQFASFAPRAAVGGGGGVGAPFRSLTDCGCLVATGGAGQVFSCIAIVGHVRQENCLYRACPKPDCNKKVQELNGAYRCEKCQTVYPTFNWRFILSVNLMDHSNSKWVTCFQDIAVKLLGVSAAELDRMRPQPDGSGGQASAYNAVFERSRFHMYVFTLRVRMEHFQDELRQKLVAQDVRPVEFVDTGRMLIGDIREATSRLVLHARTAQAWPEAKIFK